MKERTLEAISLFITIVGILVILYASERIDLETIEISKINSDFLDLKVKIEGQVTRITETEEITILEVKDNSDKIKIVIFESKKLTLSPGAKVSVSGKVTEYNGELEIIADEIMGL